MGCKDRHNILNHNSLAVNFSISVVKHIFRPLKPLPATQIQAINHVLSSSPTRFSGNPFLSLFALRLPILNTMLLAQGCTQFTPGFLTSHPFIFEIRGKLCIRASFLFLLLFSLEFVLTGMRIQREINLRQFNSEDFSSFV